MIRKGEEWGTPGAGPPDVTVEGTDADLALASAQHAGALVWFRPRNSDLGRALGLAEGAQQPGTTAVEVDVLALDDTSRAVNAAILGTPPERVRWGSRTRRVEVLVDGRATYQGRATTVVVAGGQFVHGLDVVPRGHPGDGRAEVQVYGMRRSERRAMRARLATGSHVAHPRIGQWSGRRVEVRVAGRPWPLEVDGVGRGRVGRLGVEVLPGALRLLV